MKNMLIAIITLSAILLSGCGNTESGTETQDMDFNEPTNVLSASSDMLQLCLGIEDEMYRNMCAAAMGKNADICSLVKHEKSNDQIYFQGMCRMWVAAAKKDFESCANIHAMIQGKDLISCKDFIAETMKDEKLCAKLDSENARNGCAYRVKVAKGELKLSECEEPECVFEYALKNRDEKACDSFSDVTTAFIEESRYACKAMVNRDNEDCRQAPGGMFGWELCMKKAGMGKAILDDGSFEPSECGDDDLCTRAVLVAMVSKLASD